MAPLASQRSMRVGIVLSLFVNDLQTYFRRNEASSSPATDQPCAPPRIVLPHHLPELLDFRASRTQEPPHVQLCYGVDQFNDCKYTYRPAGRVEVQRVYSLSLLPKKRKCSCQQFPDGAFFNHVRARLPPPHRHLSPRLSPLRRNLTSVFRASLASASPYPPGHSGGISKLPPTSGPVTLNSRAWI